MNDPAVFPGPGPCVRVYILDDHELVRAGPKRLLGDQSDCFEVVGESGSAGEAARRIPALRPDVALLDARLPDGSGFQVCRDVLAVDPSLKCLILTGECSPDASRAARSAGARGFVLKQADSTHLMAALRVVAAGGTIFPPETVLPPQYQGTAVLGRDRLNAREQKILQLLGQGLTNQQISDEMYLSVKTVKNYVSSILAKLGLRHRTEAAIHARRLGQQDST